MMFLDLRVDRINDKTVCVIGNCATRKSGEIPRDNLAR